METDLRELGINVALAALAAFAGAMLATQGQLDSAALAAAGWAALRAGLGALNLYRKNR
jgi:hypothetical protein